MSATRPWEETWDNGRDFEVTVSGPELDRDIDAPRELLARSAPDMARAIKAFLSDNGHTPDCGHNGTGVFASDDECSEECRSARAALRKAGVL